ncbi:MAG: family 16 glycoside hydrolase [Candidatus Aminicenantales bacterium]
MSARRAFASVVIAAAVALLASGPAPADETLADRVSALLLEFPAASAVKVDEAASALIRLGPAAVADLCGRLAAPGTADDSLARFALDAVAVRAARPGAENERISVAKAIADSLDRVRDTENQTFLIFLLQKTGKAEIVRPLAGMISRPALTGPVVRALVAAGVPDAETALVKALKGAGGASAVAIIRGLGELRSRSSVPDLLRLAGGGDSVIRAAALDALADIGDPSARPVLERVKVAAPAAERAGASFRLLRLGRRLAESGRAADAAAIALPFLSDYTAPGEDHVRAAALTLYVDAVGEKNSWEALRAAALSPDGKYRQKALDLAAGPRTGWSASDWIGLIGQAAPDAQADLILFLARRGETAALAVIREKTRSGDSLVRQAAAVAAARLGGADVWDDLVPLFKTGDEAEIKAADSAARLFPSDILIPRIAEILPETPPSAQAKLLGLLAERKAKPLSAAVLSLCSSGDVSVRAAAIAALEGIVSGSDLSALVEMLLQDRPALEINGIQNATAAAALQVPDLERRAAPILDALARVEGPKKIDLLRPLAKIGGAAALEAVWAATQNPDPQIQAVAVHTLSLWPDESALPRLFGLAKSVSDRKFRYLSLQGIARLIPMAAATPEAKLSGLREALATAVETDEKILVLDGIAAARIPAGLETIRPFLDDPEISVRAAKAVLRLVMPALGYEGMTGLSAASALKKAVPFIDYEFDRVPAESRFLELLLKDGFQPLFNGKDLSGWKGLVADPPKRAKMPTADLVRAQAEADAVLRAHWRVVDGVLSFDGKGDSLCTAKDYGDFEMFVDWKIEPDGDSGIYLRGSPQVQIWDPARWPEGSGGLYNNQKNPNKPLVPADRPVGEWNTFYIRMAGERVTVDLNGVRVVDDVVMENYWERDKPIYPEGQIELQSHNTPLAFRNIFLREISGNKADDPEGGFALLFNGRDLTGWAGDTSGYAVEDGAIVALPESGGNLYTENEYADFALRFEFKLTPGANNGIGIRTTPAGDAAYEGMEIQVLDDSAEIYKDLKPYQYHGSIYGIVPARRGFQKPVGEWNSEEIAVRGRKVTVVLNGTTIVEADLDEAAAPQTMDGRDHPGLKRTAGRIAFCGHGSRVEFRNIRIRTGIS